MFKWVKRFQHSLSMKLILTSGLTLLLCISTWAYFNIKYQKQKVMNNVMAGADRLGTTIRLGTHYAMMLNLRDDITQIINNIARQKDIQTIRIYNKKGQIKFSSHPEEVDQFTNIEAEACYVCHRTEPPLTKLEIEDKVRVFKSESGQRLLGLISPIHSEAGCATRCHVHPQGKQILGALDLVVSLEEMDKDIFNYEKGIIGLAIFSFVVTSAIIFIVVMRFVNRPIRTLIHGTREIAQGNYNCQVILDQADEMVLLARAVNRMGREISQKQAALNRQVGEYQKLFDDVPCMISVQDTDYRLLRFNRMFAEQFSAKVGEPCFRVYKGLAEKCPHCPVEKTFTDGLRHVTEESGVSRDGSRVHWMVMTSPLRNESGEIIGAMEMSLDITQRRQLEEALAQSRQKYQDIFDNMPNPVFVLDADSLIILDCNASMTSVYGYAKQDVIGESFLMFFLEPERAQHAEKLRTAKTLDKVRQCHKLGKAMFINLRISPSTWPGMKVLLVTASDITRRLETEYQLMHAAKMATLGEMATGVAHELNQPLSFMKTTSTFFIHKIKNREKIDDAILLPMLEKIDANVDRASKIITHMRNFARKTDVTLEKVQLNDIIARALEIFSQQLKLREIEVIWQAEENLPLVSGDPGRLEQVFINLLVNARDSLEAKWAIGRCASEKKQVMLSTHADDREVVAVIKDTGQGISPDLAEKIFEPFFTTKEVGKGTGLGLSISYGIVKESGGNIRLDAAWRDGACFVLSFPLAPKETADDG